MKTLLLMIAGLACLCMGAAQAQEDDSAGESFDGLVLVKNGVFDRVWAEPEVDLSRYDKIMLAPARFEFRTVRSTGSSRSSSSKSEFPISEKNQQRLIETVTEVFDEELRKSEHFTIATEPGPDVLILQGALLDIVSRVPPEPAGRGNVYLSRIGEATLVLQLSDSMSGEVLVRAAERRAAEPAGRGAVRSSAPMAWSEVRRLARRWGSKLTRGLDSVHAGR